MYRGVKGLCHVFLGAWQEHGRSRPGVRLLGSWVYEVPATKTGLRYAAYVLISAGAGMCVGYRHLASDAPVQRRLKLQVVNKRDPSQ